MRPRRTSPCDLRTEKPRRSGASLRWARLVSNQRPLACEITGGYCDSRIRRRRKAFRAGFVGEWGQRDSRERLERPDVAWIVFGVCRCVEQLGTPEMAHRIAV